MSKMSDSIVPHVTTIINGVVISIDPSSGSRASMPGYAIFKAGKFYDSGVIKLNISQNLQNRLYALREALQKDFKDIQPDILVTENIPPIMQNGFNRNMASLQKSIGVVISCFNCPLIEVAPISWRKYIPDNYLKTDENDAIMMALTTLKVANPDYIIEDKIVARIAGKEW